MPTVSVDMPTETAESRENQLSDEDFSFQPPVAPMAGRDFYFSSGGSSDESVSLPPAGVFQEIVLVELFSGLLPGSLAADALNIPVAGVYFSELDEAALKVAAVSAPLGCPLRADRGSVCSHGGAHRRLSLNSPVRDFGGASVPGRVAFERRPFGSARPTIRVTR